MGILLAAWLAAIVGCAVACGGDSPTEASLLSGTFDLATVDNQSLPFVDFIVPMTLDTLYTTGGEARTLSRGRLSLVRRKRWHTTSAGVQPESSDTLVVTFTESGNMIFIEYPAYTDTAQVTANTLTIKTFVNHGQGNIFHRSMLYSRR